MIDHLELNLIHTTLGLYVASGMKSAAVTIGLLLCTNIAHSVKSADVSKTSKESVQPSFTPSVNEASTSTQEISVATHELDKHARQTASPTNRGIQITPTPRTGVKRVSFSSKVDQREKDKEGLPELRRSELKRLESLLEIQREIEKLEADLSSQQPTFEGSDPTERPRDDERRIKAERLDELNKKKDELVEKLVDVQLEIESIEKRLVNGVHWYCRLDSPDARRMKRLEALKRALDKKRKERLLNAEKVDLNAETKNAKEKGNLSAAENSSSTPATNTMTYTSWIMVLLSSFVLAFSLMFSI